MAGLLYVRTGNGGADAAVEISDLGFTVPTGAGWTLLSEASPADANGNTGQFTGRELRDSADLFDLIRAGTLEWSRDGSTVAEILEYVADYSIMQDFSDDFLDLSDGRFVTPQGVTLPPTSSGIEGEIFWDSDDDALYTHDGTSWILIATSSGVNSDHGDLTGLADDDHSQYLLLSGDRTRNNVTGSIDLSGGDYFVLPQATDVSTTFTAGEEGALAWDTDDDVLYAHDGTQWFGLAPASGIITDHGGLTGLNDDDHTQYGLLAGNAARNPVTGEYDFSSGDLILPSDGALKGSPVEGNVEVVSGVLYAYDSTRSKWLSVDRKLIEMGKKANANDVYLRTMDSIASSETGYRVLRDGTITGLFAQTDGAESWTLEIRRNGVATPIASLTISSASGAQETTTNVDVSQGDELQFFANTSTGNIRSPIGGIELAWRTA